MNLRLKLFGTLNDKLIINSITRIEILLLSNKFLKNSAAAKIGTQDVRTKSVNRERSKHKFKINSELFTDFFYCLLILSSLVLYLGFWFL